MIKPMRLVKPGGTEADAVNGVNRAWVTYIPTMCGHSFGIDHEDEANPKPLTFATKEDAEADIAETREDMEDWEEYPMLVLVSGDYVSELCEDTGEILCKHKWKQD